jgi:hypothetical protein
MDTSAAVGKLLAEREMGREELIGVTLSWLRSVPESGFHLEVGEDFERDFNLHLALTRRDAP